VESNPLLFGVLGVIISLTLGFFLWWKIGPSFDSIYKDFNQQRLQEGFFNVSSSSVGKYLVMLFLFAILTAPCVLCLFSTFLISTGRGF